MEKRTRIFIYTKDIVHLTRRSERFCSEQLQAVRKKVGKAMGQMVTIREYCDYMNLQYEETYTLINAPDWPGN